MKVVVIGGGIIGLSSAYYLRQHGIEVVVCEKSNIGSGSTERANGGIRAQFSTPEHIELSKKSIEVWNGFEEQFETDISYRKNGYLYVARKPETFEIFKKNVNLQNKHDVPSKVLTSEEACSYCPELRTERFVGATFSPTDGFADPHLALQGYATAAKQAGATIRTGTEVTNIKHSNESNEGMMSVETSDGTIKTDYVVNAGGPWARKIASLAGIDLPVVPKRRQLMIVEPEQPVGDKVPMTADVDNGFIFRPEREGNALMGGGIFGHEDTTADPDLFSKKLNIDWSLSALELANSCAHYFGDDTKIKRGWAGLYAVTPDHHPVIEETIPGFVNAVGFSGHGFMHSPATGKIVSELITNGTTTLVDISRLTVDRFETGEGLHENLGSF